VQRTVRVTVEASPEVVETIRLYNLACNLFLRLGFVNHKRSKKALQALGYYAVRRRWPALNSSSVQCARDQAAEILKREAKRPCSERERRLGLPKPLPVKRPHSSARFNDNVFTPFLDSRVLSVSTVAGRRKLPLRIPAYFEKWLVPESRVASVRIGEKNGRWFLDLVMDLPDVPAREAENPVVVGMDRGITNVAVLGTGEFFHSKELRSIRGKYAYLRGRLQAAGTRSARRHLRLLSGRERRFQADRNHRIAKQVAALEFDVLALEDLSIRPEKEKGRRFNRKLGGWAHAQLEGFLRYKLEEVGKRVVLVPPEYTSKMCSRCGLLGSRKGSAFRCSCGFSLNADLNGARNIGHLGNALVVGPTVNRPIVADRGERSVAQSQHLSSVTSPPL